MYILYMSFHSFSQTNDSARKLVLVHMFDRIRGSDWNSVATFTPALVNAAPELCGEYFLKQLQSHILEHRDAFFALPCSRTIIDDVFIPLCQRSAQIYLKFLAFLLSLQRAIKEHGIADESIPRLCEAAAAPASDDAKLCAAMHSALQSLVFLYHDTAAGDVLQQRSKLYSPAAASIDTPHDESEHIELN